MKKNKLILVIPIVILIDQISKLLIRLNLDTLQIVVVIKNFFYLTYAKNVGAAWSILEGKQIFLILIGFIFLFILINFIKKEKDINNLALFSYYLVISGIIGNLIDRIVFNYVTDFLSLNLFGYYFPVFNVADMSIVIGIFILIIDTVRSDFFARNNSRNRK